MERTTVDDKAWTVCLVEYDVERTQFLRKFNALISCIACGKFLCCP